MSPINRGFVIFNILSYTTKSFSQTINMYDEPFQLLSTLFNDELTRSGLSTYDGK